VPATALLLLALWIAPALAGVVDFAIGAYGGMDLPLEEDASAGTVIGAKLRVLPPIPIIAFEAWYAHFGYEDPQAAAEDLSLALDGDGFDLWGIDALIGGVRGTPGFKWYGVVGVNAPEFEELGKKERKLGGELGFGLEIVPPALGLGFEGRGAILFPDISGSFDEKLLTVTVGVNYYF
jgi:hypothetical protein